MLQDDPGDVPGRVDLVTVIEQDGEEMETGPQGKASAYFSVRKVDGSIDTQKYTASRARSDRLPLSLLEA